MREELFWDRDKTAVSPRTEIERAINFGGFDYIDEVQKKFGRKEFIATLMTGRSLSRKAVSYWCLKYGLKRENTAVFRQKPAVWLPIR